MPVAEENADGIGEFVGDGKIKFAVAIEVSDCNGSWAVAGVDDRLRAKCSVAVAQEYADGPVGFVRDGQINVAVPVEIRRCHITGLIAQGHWWQRDERDTQ